MKYELRANQVRKFRKISAQYSTAEAGSVADRLAARMRRVMFQYFLDSTSVRAKQTILDVGVTSDDKLEASNYLEAWYPHKDRITACGIDDASFLELKYPGVRYIKADGRSLPFPDGHFDVVHSSAVLEHVGSREQQRAFIAELVRVARHAAFLTTPNRWFPVEFHSSLPVAHWLPPRAFRMVLRTLGHDLLSREENLNLLGASDIHRLCQELCLRDFDVRSVRLFGWPSNLLLTVRKQNNETS